MNILIFGATGSIGRNLIEQGLAANHVVTAFVRTPSKIEVRHPNLNIMQGDVLQASTITPALQGQDAVLIAIGAGKNSTLLSVLKAQKTSLQRWSGRG